MGVFGDRLVADYFGNQVEILGALTGLTKGKYTLLVNGLEADSVELMMGEAILKGRIRVHDEEKLLQVHVSQGVLGAKFAASVEGHRVPLEKLK